MATNYFLTKQIVLLFVLLFVGSIGFFYQKEMMKSSYHPSYAQVPSTVQLVQVERELIATFPYIPVYPGAIVDESYKKTLANATGYEAEWYTTDSVRQVITYYIQTLPQEGWTLDSIPENFDSYENQIVAHKGEQKMHLIIEVAETKDNITEIVAEFPLQ